MSRWREMLMDYGQVFNGGSKASSEFFSVDGDLEDKTSEDRELRRSLEVNYRPLFQRYVYGGEKMACHDLRRVIRDPEYKDLIPPDKLSELADIIDFNKGRAISYTEFVRIVMGEDTLEEDDTFSFDSKSELPVTKSKYAATGILPVVCRNITAQELVEETVREYKCFPPAFFMILVTVAQVVVYIYYGIQKPDERFKPLEGIGESNELWYTPVRRREAWRFVTYCFLHDGYVDLIFNVLFQLCIGIPVEIIFSWWRVAIVYTCGVIMGSLGQSVADHYVGLVGASGGAYAILFAHVIAMWENRKSLNNNKKESAKKRILCSITLRFIVILILVVVQVALGVYRRFFADAVPEIGIAGYIGGIVAGYLLGRAFLKDPNRYPWQAGAGFLSIFLFLAFVGFAVIFNIVYVYYPVEQYD